VCGREGLIPYVWMKWTVLADENTRAYWGRGTEFVGTADTADRHIGYLLHKTQRVSNWTVV